MAHGNDLEMLQKEERKDDEGGVPENGVSESAVGSISEEDLSMTWLEWHGMDVMYPIIKNAVTPDADGNINGWAALLLAQGVAETKGALTRNLDTFNIVEGLLLSATIALCVEPPDSLAMLDEVYQTGYIVALWTSVIIHLMGIIMSVNFSGALNACVRDADAYRMLIRFGWINTANAGLFILGSIFIAVAMGVICAGTYTVGALIYGVCIWAVMMVIAPVLNSKGLKTGHVVHGWLKQNMSDPDPFELDFLLLQLKKRHDVALHYKRISAEIKRKL